MDILLSGFQSLTITNSAVMNSYGHKSYGRIPRSYIIRSNDKFITLLDMVRYWQC